MPDVHSSLLPSLPSAFPLPSNTTLESMSLTARSSSPPCPRPWPDEASSKRASKLAIWGATSSSSSGTSCPVVEGCANRFSRFNVEKPYFLGGTAGALASLPFPFTSTELEAAAMAAGAVLVDEARPGMAAQAECDRVRIAERQRDKRKLLRIHGVARQDCS